MEDFQDKLHLLTESTFMDDSLYKTLENDESIQKFVKLDLKQKLLLQENAKRINNIKPYERPDKDHISTLFNYRTQYESNKKEQNKNGCSIRSSFISTKQHSSHKELCDLKPINLKDMKVNKIHYGYYLECKTIVEPFYIAGMNLLIEDKNGNIENLILYNYSLRSYQIDPNNLIPQGTKLLIKEPFLKFFASAEKEFGIRVDSPTDILIITNEAKKSLDKIIEDGNVQFQKNNFNLSASLYTQAVLKSNKTNIRALLNRSQAYIKLERFQLAYEDAKIVTQIDSGNEKGFFRMGRTSYLMRKYDQAKKSLEICLKLNKENKEAKFELDKSIQRINESVTGNYDFEKMLAKYLKKECLNFDIAEFKSPKINVVDIPNKYKGVKANEDIKKGELLVVSKALTASFKKKSLKDFLIKVNFITNNCDLNDGCENFSNIVYKMQSDPEIAKQVYSLYAGLDYDRDAIFDSNIIDIARIDGIQRFNSFGIEKDFDFIESNIESLFDQESGFWIFPAFFNHSCVGNAIRLFIGDVICMYAKMNIKKDEEITVKYFSGDYSERSENALKNYNFKCDCKLCQLDKDDPYLKSRESLLQEIKMKNLLNLSLNEAFEDVKKMRNLYLNRKEYQFDMILPLQNLAIKLRENFNFKKSASIYMELYDINKERACLVAIDALKDAYNDFKICNQTEKCEYCYKLASEYFENNKVFFERFWLH